MGTRRAVAGVQMLDGTIFDVQTVQLDATSAGTVAAIMYGL